MCEDFHLNLIYCRYW